MLHGDCNVHYTINNVMTMRAVNHIKDCKNRPYRHIDDWRGWRCDEQWFEQSSKLGEGRNDPDPITSKSDAYYIFEQRDGKRVVKEMGTESGVGTRFYSMDGNSKFVYTRRNMKLQDVKRSSGNINPTGTKTYDDITYEMLNTYSWKKDRDLKATEEFLDSGSMIIADQKIYVQGAMSVLDEMYKNFDLHDASAETVEKLHKYGVEKALMYMIQMNYNSIESVFNALEGDNSEPGVAKKKMFLEFLPSTGTSATAMFIIDCVKQGKCFEDASSSGRAILGIPYHIRRPNNQLIKEMRTLMDLPNQEEALEKALPLAVAHLTRRTCELAGKDMLSKKFQNCINSLIDPMADEYFAKFEATEKEEEKMELLAVLQNLRWGKISELLHDFINTRGSDALKSDAVTAAMYSTFLTQNTAAYFLPILTNPLLGTETRVNALMSFIYGKFDITQLSTVVTTLYTEQNYEFKNFAYSLFDTFSNTINPCFKKKRDLISYFYKLMKQVGSHDINYGFGISKIYFQEYKSTKYQNTGSNGIALVGSTTSQVPLKLSVWLMTSQYEGYGSSLLHLELRFEGLSRTVIEKFQSINSRDWKLKNLESLLTSMNVGLKPQEPIRVGITVTLKGTIITKRMYFSEADEASKKITSLLNDLRGRGGKNSYTINHQRGLNYGMEVYEQPTDAGIPMFYTNSMTSMLSLQAEVKKGLSKGVLFREFKNDIHFVTNGNEMISFLHGKNKFHLYQSRAYSLHVPQALVIGVNIVKQELQIEVKRPPQSDPLFLILHAKTVAGVRELSGAASKLKTYCSTCETEHELAKGDPTSKAIAEDDNSEYGYRLWGQYFDCEADLSDANVGGNAVFTFHPQNKNPQTFMTSLMMGLRQARSFVLFYPQSEKCGAYMQWSQSSVNPVSEIQFSAQLKFNPGEHKYFYRGR